MRALFSGLSADRARIYALVLAASGIAHHVRCRKAQWSIVVSIQDRYAAVEAIRLYLKENPDTTFYDQGRLSSGVKTYSAGYVASVLFLIHLLIGPESEQQVFISAFGADADRIVNGEIYRCATALLLHSDLQHLLGNIAGIIVFGTAVASQCGWGIGWLLVLAAGVTGNLITAFWYQGDHIAIGASTAVFAAVGICSAIQMRFSIWNRTDKSEYSWRKLMPLMAGLALLGLLGTSPRADLMAHLSGFAVGLVLGFGIGLKRGRPLYQMPFWAQLAAAVLSVGTVAASWLQGQLYKG